MHAYQEGQLYFVTKFLILFLSFSLLFPIPCLVSSEVSIRYTFVKKCWLKTLLENNVGENLHELFWVVYFLGHKPKHKH